MEGESGDAETGKLTWSGKSDESGGDRWGRGWRTESGSWFQRRGDACRKEQSVIFRVERVDGRARVTTDEERVLRGGWKTQLNTMYWVSEETNRLKGKFSQANGWDTEVGVFWGDNDSRPPSIYSTTTTTTTTNTVVVALIVIGPRSRVPKSHSSCSCCCCYKSHHRWNKQNNYNNSCSSSCYKFSKIPKAFLTCSYSPQIYCLRFININF